MSFTFQGEQIDVVRLLIRQTIHEIETPLLQGEEVSVNLKCRVKNTNFGENYKTGEMVCTLELKVLEVEVVESGD